MRRSCIELGIGDLNCRVVLGRDGDLRWLDRATNPARVLDHEPDTDAGQRLQARFFRALPIESQL